MKQRSALLLTFVLAMIADDSCVPAGEELEPKGAAGWITEPSPATRGEPFLTDDGWLVRIDKLALITRVSVGDVTDDTNERYMWNGTTRAELLVRAVPTGPRSLVAQLEGAGRRFDSNGVEVPAYRNLDVEPSLEVRLKPLDDAGPPPAQGPPRAPGPSIVLVARGEKGGFVVVLDVALSAPPRPENSVDSTVDVRANDVTFTQLDVAAERLFGIDASSERGAMFQPLADADARGDGDGRVTDAELRETAPDVLSRLTSLVGELLEPR
jgi:hypothetical protein